MVFTTRRGYVCATQRSNRQSEGGVADQRDAAGLPVGAPSPTHAADRWIGIEAAARHLAIPTRTMYRLAQRHNIPAVKVGRTWRFRSSSLDAYLERMMLAQASDGPAPAPAVPAIARRAPLGSLEGDPWGEISGELATLTGPAEALFLVLWGRGDAGAVQAGGDPAILAGWRALGSP